MEITIKTDQLTKEIISIISENLLDTEFSEEGIEMLRQTTNGQLVKRIFDSYLLNNWDCNISTLHTLANRLDSLPCELIPTSLFGAAIKDALNQVNWDTVARHKDIQSKIEQLKVTNTPSKITEESVLTEIKVVNIMDSYEDTSSPNYQTSLLYNPPTWFHTITTGETFLFSQIVHVKWNIEDDNEPYKSFNSLVSLSDGSKVNIFDEDRQRLLDALRINIKLTPKYSFIVLPNK